MFQLNMDCEGPLTQNDNAFELCHHFIPKGGKFFSIVSKYDDFLADVIKKPGYKAGDTLKLVLPFLKAYGVTDSDMEEFSQRTLVLLPGTEVMLPKVNHLLPSFIISTSYKPYIEALCKVTSFPMDNCYCTEVNLEHYPISSEEAEKLKDFASEIAAMEMLDWSQDAQGVEDLEGRHRENIKRLDEIFWQIIPSMSIGVVMDKVNPIGGSEKAKAVEDSLRRTGLDAGHVIYAGDSITDTQALELVKRGGGVAISFNGNRYALRSATIALLSSNTCILYALAALFEKEGLGILEKISINSQGQMDLRALVDKLDSADIPSDIASQVKETLDGGILEMYSVKDSNFQELVKKSERIRKEVRGHKVGELG